MAAVGGKQVGHWLPLGELGGDWVRARHTAVGRSCIDRRLKDLRGGGEGARWRQGRRQGRIKANRQVSGPNHTGVMGMGPGDVSKWPHFLSFVSYSCIISVIWHHKQGVPHLISLDWHNSL